jgi:hypothetical protein
VSAKLDAVGHYMDAVAHPDEGSIGPLETVLADDVSSRGPFGSATGKAAVVEGLTNPRTSAMLATATWTEPSERDGVVRVSATTAPGSMVGGFDYSFEFDRHDRIVEIKQRMIPAPPPPETDIDLSGPIADAVNAALANGTPILVAYADDAGQPHLSYRGTAQVYSSQQLAVWARDPQGGLPRALSAHPPVTLMYRDTATRTNYIFYGRGQVSTDEAVRTRVFDESPEAERNFDPDRTGAAIVIDVDKVEGSGPAGRILMVRGAATQPS